MIDDSAISVSCPNGHALVARAHHIGRKLVCPVCKSHVKVSRRSERVTDSSVMQILGDRVPGDMSQGRQSTEMIEATDAKPDRLSDTGVMRILGDFDPQPQVADSVNDESLHKCPACSRVVSDPSAVCPHCHRYTGLQPSFLKSLLSK